MKRVFCKTVLNMLPFTSIQMFLLTSNLRRRLWSETSNKTSLSNVSPQISINLIDEAWPAIACGLHLICSVMTSIGLTYVNAKMSNMNFFNLLLFWTNWCRHFMYPLVTPVSSIYFLWDFCVCHSLGSRGWGWPISTQNSVNRFG